MIQKIVATFFYSRKNIVTENNFLTHLKTFSTLMKSSIHIRYKSVYVIIKKDPKNIHVLISELKSEYVSDSRL
jgi:hypothetical protein